ncbi:MAG: hypothetical protein IIC96_19480 [Chloroflexi bacterium]|nr:hypothetical protein [Chloroflexota bacterium]
MARWNIQQRFDARQEVIPGANATSAARYLQECLDGSVYHDVHAPEHFPDDVRQWILQFLGANAPVTAA